MSVSILRSDVEKVIEAADRDDYSVIVVGEKHLAFSFNPLLSKKYLEGLGVDSLDFQTNIDDLKDEVSCNLLHSVVLNKRVS